MPQHLNKNLYDVAQAFNTFMVFNGDVAKTALALDLDQQVVRDLANAEHWIDKITEWKNIREGSKDAQIEFNRAVNYVQAHRLRQILDKIIQEFGDKTGPELIELMTKETKDGKEFVSRPITDLVKAAEACHAMTQRALGDSSTVAPHEEGKGSQTVLMVQKAMAAADQIGIDSVSIVRKQLNP